MVRVERVRRQNIRPRGRNSGVAKSGPRIELGFLFWHVDAQCLSAVLPRYAARCAQVAFIDMNKIHALNEVLGYTEVDLRIKETFSVPFRRAQD